MKIRETAQESNIECGNGPFGASCKRTVLPPGLSLLLVVSVTYLFIGLWPSLKDHTTLCIFALSMRRSPRSRGGLLVFLARPHLLEMTRSPGAACPLCANLLALWAHPSGWCERQATECHSSISSRHSPLPSRQRSAKMLGKIRDVGRVKSHPNVAKETVKTRHNASPA